MKQFLKIMIVLLITGGFVNSCNETGPNDSCTLENEFALQTGNWWVYDVYETDISGAKIDGSEKTDSVIVAGTTVIFDKTAYILHHYIYSPVNGYEYDTTYFAVENNAVYKITSVELFGNERDMSDTACGCIPNWYKIADCSREKWNNFSEEYTEVGTALGNGNEPFEYTLTFSYNSSGAYSGTVMYNYNDMAVESQHFKSYLNVDASMNLTGLEFLNNPRRNIQGHYMVTENIGVVQYSREPYQAEPYKSCSVYCMYNGIHYNLLRYSVNL